ncbi:MAG: amidohydrolase family protein, partial [Terriglobales bacterium]
ASVRLIAAGKARGVRVTAEVTPHHLTLTDADIRGYDANFKMNPPLRSAADREALIAALADGTIDAVATDHAPHAPHEKEQEFSRAPFGIIGLETALPLVLRLVAAGRLSLPRAIAVLTSGPAQCFSLPGGSLASGAPADITVFDPAENWVCDPALLRSKSRNTPFAGQTMTGRVRHTIVAGRVVYSAG